MMLAQDKSRNPGGWGRGGGFWGSLVDQFSVFLLRVLCELLVFLTLVQVKETFQCCRFLLSSWTFAPVFATSRNHFYFLFFFPHVAGVK